MDYAGHRIKGVCQQERRLGRAQNSESVGNRLCVPCNAGTTGDGRKSERPDVKSGLVESGSDAREPAGCELVERKEY